MCGRFVNTTNVNKLKKIFEIELPLNTKKDIISYNIAPSQDVNIILNDKHLTIEAINWGIQFIDKKSNQLRNVINSRLETIQEKILFKESFIKRRCLIPANGYYEWQSRNGVKSPYFIQVPTLETIYFAGLWKYSDVTESTKKTFSILTKKANDLIHNIHQRMPVILNADEAINYIDQTQNFMQTNFVSKIEEDLDFISVSKFVNSPKNNSIECIQPIS